MYEAFFGLKEPPFKMTPDPQFFYVSEKHREALAQCIYGMKEKKGFIVITGEEGVGKTALIHYLLESINGSSHTRTAFILNPNINITGSNFLGSILKDLGVISPGGSKGDSIQILYQNLLKAYEEDKGFVLFVDDAQDLTRELIEEIRLLSNLETSKSKLIQIVLIGQPDLEKTLLRPDFRQVRQRINLWYHLGPLSKKESEEYIAKRLKIAGSASPIFTEAAIEKIYRKSKGIPGLINILCNRSLEKGYALDQRVVDKREVQGAVKDLSLNPFWGSVWVWLLFGVLAGGGLLFIAIVSKRLDLSGFH